RLLALVRLPEPAVEAGEDVVVRRGPGVESDRLVERLHGLVEAPQALLRPRLLEPRGVGFRVELERLTRAFESLLRIARTVAVGAQADVAAREAALPFPVQGDRPLVSRDGARVVASRLEREPERVLRLDVGGVDADRGFERLARRLPVVLDGEQLAQVVL